MNENVCNNPNYNSDSWCINCFHWESDHEKKSTAYMQVRVEDPKPTGQQNPFGQLYAVFAEFDANPDNPRGEHAWNHTEILMHAISEVVEVWDAHRKGKTRQEVVNEVADVMNLAIIVAVRNRVTPEELLATCSKKLADRQRRDREGYKA